jgi:hypothetical protein
MRYCSELDFQNVLSQTFTSASPNPATLSKPGKLSDLGTKLNLTTNSGPLGPSVATFDPTSINYFIRQAASMIDATVKQQYEVPLTPKVKFKSQLIVDMDEYTSAFAQLSQSFNMNPGDHIVFIQNGLEEWSEVSDVQGEIVTFNNPLSGLYTTFDKVLVVSYPDPIPLICAQLACAMFYDKWARAQSEPMKTEYGDTLRKEAIAELNNIREGRTILADQDRIGDGFVNPYLIRRYGLKALDVADGTRSDSNRG